MWAETAAVYWHVMLAWTDELPLGGYDSCGVGVSVYGVAHPRFLAVQGVDNILEPGVWYRGILPIPDVVALRGRELLVGVACGTDELLPSGFCVDDLELVFGCGDQRLYGQSKALLERMDVPLP